MLKNNKIKLVAGAAMIIAVGGCTKDESSTTAAASTTTAIATLPKATGKVVSEGSSGYNGILATTGIALKSTGVASNWTGKSREMCEVAQATREIFSEAMQPDKIGCYMGAILKNNKFVGANVLSGDYVYFKLTNMPGGAGFEPRIKMKAVLTGSKVTNFEMFSCFSSSGGSPVQSEYLSIVDANSSVTLTAKYVGSDGGNSYGSSVTATGAVNSSGEWTSKTISGQKFWNGGSNGAFYQVGSFTQYASSMTFALSNYGTFGSSTPFIFSAAMSGAAQLLNSATPKSLALGDMSVKYEIDSCMDQTSGSGCANENAYNSGGSRWNSTGTVSIDGDSLARLATASNGTYYSTANAATLPSVTTSVSVTFSAAQAWDCAAVGDWGTVDLTDMENTATGLGTDMAACDAQFSYQADSGSNGYACGAAQ